MAELWLRWGRLSAVHHGGRARPSLPWWRRLVTPATRYAIRLGRGPCGRRLWARREEQTLILAPPRVGKSGLLADRVIDDPGAALVTESRPDILTATAGFRARLGPIEVFNPEHVAGIPSTFRWAITEGCDDPAEATRRAADLVGAVADTGEMRWWVEKSATALAAAMHAAGLTGDDMTAVWGRRPAGDQTRPARDRTRQRSRPCPRHPPGAVARRPRPHAVAADPAAADDEPA